jgi:histidinol-phosphate aminotransferase
MYKTSTQTQGGIYTEIPLKNFDLDTEAVLSTISEKTKLIFLCSPNNPTGNLLSSEKIFNLLKFTDKKCLVVVDEAYFEFSDSESWANQLENFPHLVVLRTLSKAYGLAGLRVGVAGAHQEVLQILKKVLAPYPIAACVEAEVLKSDLSGQTRALILEQKKSLIDGLSKCKVFSTIYPSHANFILCKISDQASIKSADLVSALRENGVIIRDRNSDFGLDNCVRITVGTEEQNNILLERISSFEKKNSIR